MKNYRIPVTYSASVVVEHEVRAKSMQAAQFALGQLLASAENPFDCVSEGDNEVKLSVSAGSPTIVPDSEQPELTPLDTGI